MNRRDDASYVDDLRSAVSMVSLTAKVVLGRTRISFSDAMNLEVGDVIKTSTKYDSPIELWIGNHPLFHCRPGMLGSNMAIVISDSMADSEKHV
jgi:flagellar motor switch protein FliM